MSMKRQQHWDRLQREYRQAVSAEYPNPERKDCPGREALLRLVSLLPEDLQRDPRWRHAVQCGPCYEEYIALRDIPVMRLETESRAIGKRLSPDPRTARRR
jgi:hypothetical protein